MKGSGGTYDEHVVVVVGLCVLALILLLGMIAKMFRKAGPNEAIIVYGFRGPRVIKGHGDGDLPHGGKQPPAVA